MKKVRLSSKTAARTDTIRLGEVISTIRADYEGESKAKEGKCKGYRQMGFGDIEKEAMAKRFKEEKYESVSE